MKISTNAAVSPSGRPVVIVSPAGRLDAAGANLLQAELERQLEAAGPHIVVDLADTRYISSNGLRVLLSAHKEAQDSGGGLKLARLSPRLLQIFEMAGFDQIFEIFDAPAAAAQSF